MKWFRRSRYIDNFVELGDILHESGLDAYSYPPGRGQRNLSAFDWDEFRQQVARDLLKRCDIILKK